MSYLSMPMEMSPRAWEISGRVETEASRGSGDGKLLLITADNDTS